MNFPFWLVVLIGLFMAYAIVRVGVASLRSFSPDPDEEKIEGSEDVEELDVFFVCGECGTEFRVTRLGQLQVPRHCGEKMLVERRSPATGE